MKLIQIVILSSTQSILNYCQSIVMRSTLALVILSYISFLHFIGIDILILINTFYIRHEKFEMKTTIENTRF
jgi:hypothetical protein